MSEVTITANNFDEEVMKSDMPVLVDFWATWCGPCKMLSPIIAEVAEEYKGKIKVGKINVDEEPGLAVKYGISSIPTLLLFRNGQIVNSMMGYRPKADVVELLK